MSNFKFSERSEMNLKGVNLDLIALARHALMLSAVDFAVIDGLRTLEEEKKMVANGKSQTLNSRHLTGHAIDVLAYLGAQSSWDPPLYAEINKGFRQASIALNIPYAWGGDWKTLKDYGHFELARSKYP